MINEWVKTYLARLSLIPQHVNHFSLYVGEALLSLSIATSVPNVPIDIMVTWDFGDGMTHSSVPLTFNSVTGTTSTMVMSHFYEGDGDFDVSVVLSNPASSVTLNTQVS